MPVPLYARRKGLRGAAQEVRCVVSKHRWTASAEAEAVLHGDGDICPLKEVLMHRKCDICCFQNTDDMSIDMQNNIIYNKNII